MSEQPVARLNWKDRIAGIVTLSIATIFLLLQVLSLIASRADSYQVTDHSIILKRSELWNDLRLYLTIGMGLFGGFLWFRKKRWGWILSTAFLLFFLLLTAWGVFRTAGSGNKLSIGLMIGSTAFLFLCVFHLLQPRTRRKFSVSGPHLLASFSLLLLLGLLYFVLQ